jgi:hypothetical protein
VNAVGDASSKRTKSLESCKRKRKASEGISDVEVQDT